MEMRSLNLVQSFTSFQDHRDLNFIRNMQFNFMQSHLKHVFGGEGAKLFCKSRHLFPFNSEN